MARHGQMGDVAPAFVFAGWARVLGRDGCVQLLLEGCEDYYQVRLRQA